MSPDMKEPPQADVKRLQHQAELASGGSSDER